GDAGVRGCVGSRAGQVLELIRGGPRRRISWRSGQGQGALREAGYPNHIRRRRTTPRLEKRKSLPGEEMTCKKLIQRYLISASAQLMHFPAPYAAGASAYNRTSWSD